MGRAARTTLFQTFAVKILWLPYSCCCLVLNAVTTCDGLDKKYSPIVLQTWFPFGGAVWSGLCGIVLLEEVCHYGKAWILYSCSLIVVVILCFMLAFDYVSSHIFATAVMPASCYYNASPWWNPIPLDTWAQVNSFFYKLCYSYRSKRKANNTIAF